jgi:ribosome-associated protein
MDELLVNERITIPAGELRLSFARSGGPGGQNVNKVETKVELRWNPSESGTLEEADRERLLKRLASRLTSDGDLIVTSSRTRDQGRNREDARAKLVRLVNKALEKPKLRKRTRPSRASIQNRLKQKKERSRLKDSRRGGDD